MLTVVGIGAKGKWLVDTLFSRLDPLVGLAALVASRGWIAFWLAALVTVALTALLGRAWCGWICPVGTLLDILPARGGKRPAKLSKRWRIGKYVTLAVIIGAALIGRLGPMVLDPVTVVTRPLQELLRPLWGNDAITANAGRLAAQESFHAVALLSLLPLAGVLALNAISRRTWCRTLCPLGGLLALLSKAPGLRRVVDAEACTACTRCSRVCPTDAIEPDEAFASSSAECTVCMRCADECPQGAVAFRRDLGQVLSPGYRPERRDALAAAGLTGVSIVAAAVPFPRDEELLRPPATDEARLGSLCVRCGACYSACPTASLRPSLSVTTVAGPWTPMLDVRPRHCSVNCNRCAPVCPTDAIHSYTEDEKVALGIGAKASVNREWCRAWARGKECMKCQPACPIVGALQAGDRQSLTGGGGPPIAVPVVDQELCVGCNLCAESCVMRPPAIGVFRDPQGPAITY